MIVRSFARRPVARLALGLCVVLGLGFAGDSRADEDQFHADGMKALAQGRYDEAENLFRQAIAEESEETAGRFFSSVYVPHYFLGVALAEQDRCAEAIQAWSESKRQGKVQKTDYGDQIDPRISSCEARLNAIGVAKKTAEQAIERARRGARGVDDLASKQELRDVWESGDPSLASRQGQAEAQLAEARSLLERGAASGDEDLLAQAADSARKASDMLVTVEEEARTRLGQINAAAAEALSSLREAEEAAERQLRSLSSLAPYPPRLGAQVQTLKNLLGDVDKTRSTAQASEIEQATDQIVRETRALRRLAGGPPKALRDAAEAFLSGDVDTTLAILDEADLSGDRARWHAKVLQAAARHRLFVLGGETERPLLDAAVASLREAIDLGDDHGAPSERYFSPRFLELYRSTAAAAEAASAGDSSGTADGA